MMKILFGLITTICLAMNSQAQNSTVSAIGDRVLFGFLSHNPDPIVFPFFKRYFPGFTEPPKIGGWVSYPPGPLPVYELTEHSFFFKEHPFFRQNFTGGRLELFTKENDSAGRGIDDFQVWFFFDNKKDAETGFNWLCGVFDKVAKRKKSERVGEIKQVGFSDRSDDDETYFNQIILLPDWFYPGKYRILYRMWPLWDGSKHGVLR